MKKILLALDSFKGSLDAINACKIIAEVLKSDFEVYMCPMADGGEGTVEAIINARKGQYVTVKSVDHLGRAINAQYGIYENIAVIEAASVCGLNLVLPEDRNIMVSNSFGLGKLILSAIDKGVNNFIFAIGGTGTNDGGYGLARALGYRFLDDFGNDLPNTPDFLINLSRIIPTDIDINKYKFTVACDVKNTLCGDQGASFVYGYQKGGTKEQLEHLDRCLKRFAEIIEKDLGKNILALEGGGAGGGLASGIVAFCGGELKNGYSIVKEATDIETIINSVDVVVTGEGKTDKQTLYGKLPYGITLSAKKYNKPVALVSGVITDDGKIGMRNIGCDAFFSCVDDDFPKENAIKNAKTNLEKAAKNLKTWLCSLQ